MMLQIFAEHDQDVAIAYRRVEVDEWRDPYGGIFSREERESFDAFASGRRLTVMVNGAELRARLTFSKLSK